MGVVASTGVDEGRPPVVLLVACSRRKRIPTDPRLELRAVAGGDELVRLKEWKARLSGVEATTVPAQELYSGDHWSSTRRALQSAQEWNPRSSLWVMSAGYGIVAAEAPLKSYSATLTSHPDSISPVGGAQRRRQAASRWWNGLNHESTLARLLDDPNEPVLFIAGGSEYVEVLRADIERAARHRGWLDRLFVVSAGSRRVRGALPVRGAHREAVGGAMAALNARLLAFLMRSAHEHQFVRQRMEAMLEELKGMPARRLPPRRSLTDAEVVAAIETFRVVRPSLSYTSALRMLRDQDVSCERLRFKALWLEASSVS